MILLWVSLSAVESDAQSKITVLWAIGKGRKKVARGGEGGRSRVCWRSSVRGGRSLAGILEPWLFLGCAYCLVCLFFKKLEKRAVGPDESAGQEVCSPRTRGWSRRDQRRHRDPGVLPAHAGMVPVCAHPALLLDRAPRARGDGPLGGRDKVRKALCSPRTRGWSLWSVGILTRQGVLPAHAGMIPSATGRRAAAPGAPRAPGIGASPRVGRAFLWGRRPKEVEATRVWVGAWPHEHDR